MWFKAFILLRTTTPRDYAIAVRVGLRCRRRVGSAECLRLPQGALSLQLTGKRKAGRVTRLRGCVE